jgi:hypothetical protein
MAANRQKLMKEQFNFNLTDVILQFSKKPQPVRLRFFRIFMPIQIARIAIQSFGYL